MRLHTLWKQWDDDAVELLFALDEYTVEGNFQAWEDGCREARKRYGIQPEDTREIILTVDTTPIQAAFGVPEVAAAVVASDNQQNQEG